jgi:hypothetical protein
MLGAFTSKSLQRTSCSKALQGSVAHEKIREFQATTSISFTLCEAKIKKLIATILLHDIFLVPFSFQ